VLPGDHYALLRQPVVRQTARRLAAILDATWAREETAVAVQARPSV
jgi:hypothetical protein